MEAVLDAPKLRRPRYGRHPKGRPPVISARDVEIFELLDRYRVMRSGMLRAFFPTADRGDFLDRLGALYHEAPYINRLDSNPRYRSSREMQSVYELDVLGRQELRQRGLLIDQPAGALKETRNFHHSLMVCDILASIDLGCYFATGERIIHQHEIIARAPCRELERPLRIAINGELKSVTPDAVFGVRYRAENLRSAYRFFALEADRGTEPVYRSKLTETSIYRKFVQYRELLSTGKAATHFGITAPLFVLFVTSSLERMEHMRDLLRSMTKEGNSRILFKAMESGHRAPPADGRMFTEPYLRAVYPEFDIGKE